MGVSVPTKIEQFVLCAMWCRLCVICSSYADNDALAYLSVIVSSHHQHGLPVADMTTCQHVVATLETDQITRRFNDAFQLVLRWIAVL